MQATILYFFFGSMRCLEWGIEAFTKIIATRALVDVGASVDGCSLILRLGASTRWGGSMTSKTSPAELARTKGWGLTTVQNTHTI